MSAKSVITLFAVAILLPTGHVPSATAAGNYQVIDLGVAAGTNAINNKGQVAGRIQVGSDYHAVLWTIAADRSVSVRDLHADIVAVTTLAGSTNSIVYGMNDSGQIAGWADGGSVSSERAILGLPGSGASYAVMDLHAMFGTSTNPFRRAYDINNAGVLVGYLNQPNTYDPWPKGVVLSAGGPAMAPPVALQGGTHPHWTPYAISETGQIVGYCEQNPYYKAASWANSAASIRELEPTAVSPPGSSPSSWALGVNDQGVVVGRSRGTSVGSSDSAATLWDTAGSGAPVNLDSGNLFGQSIAYDINNAGQIVGWGDVNQYNSSTHDYRALFWDGGSLIDLNSTIDPASGWMLRGAYSINEAGWITGMGDYQGQVHAFALAPVPEPSSLVLLVSGLLAIAATVRVRRRRLAS